MQPQSIVNFSRIYLGSLALGIGNFIASYDSVMAELQADPVVAEMGFASLGFVLGTAAIGWGISLLIWFFIARRASKIAKWILVALTALGLAMLPSSLATMPTVSLVVTLVITAMQLVAIYFLFRPDARAWFDSKGDPAADISTFE
ncbi:MAG: hypothetical protein QNI87_08400 [Erythrobacter sp.]|uniref:hypothetical protein n=1 Tax=Erythrobacter sp. TaxID=1042 RepID=UPI0026105A0E|nr:hypothetical protein [Erythrobacter sp.]MDJ0978544.1 hypothetical protein [Erythrobacter sp.]